MLRAADEKAAEYYRRSESPYVLVSELSIVSFPFKSAQIRGCDVFPLASRQGFEFPKCFHNHREIAERVKNSKYRLVGVSTSGRSIHQAADRALEALALLRGLWSLFGAHRSWSMSFGGARRKPIGIIHSGTIHTLHNKDGSPASDVFWINSNAREDADFFKPSDDDWKKIERNRRWAMQKIKRLPYRRDAEQLLARYAYALDQPNHDVAFLQLWSILERLTDTALIGNYDETIKRTIWPFSDRPLAKEFLDCMRSHRNLFVHAARTADEPDQAAYQIKDFVDVHLLRLIQNAFHATNIEEYARHLSLSPELADLKREKQLLDKAIRYLAKKPDDGLS